MHLWAPMSSHLPSGGASAGGCLTTNARRTQTSGAGTMCYCRIVRRTFGVGSAGRKQYNPAIVCYQNIEPPITRSLARSHSLPLTLSLLNAQALGNATSGGGVTARFAGHWIIEAALDDLDPQVYLAQVARMCPRRGSRGAARRAPAAERPAHLPCRVSETLGASFSQGTPQAVRPNPPGAPGGPAGLRRTHCAERAGCAAARRDRHVDARRLGPGALRRRRGARPRARR
jgi:hypothetical protein